MEFIHQTGIEVYRYFALNLLLLFQTKDLLWYKMTMIEYCVHDLVIELITQIVQ